MNNSSKVVKYIAIALGIILSVTIISVIVTVVIEMLSALFDVDINYIDLEKDRKVDIYDKSIESSIANEYSKTFEGIKNLEIEINKVQLNILKLEITDETSQKIMVEVINKNQYINCYERENNTLVIVEKTDRKTKSDVAIVNIYVPVEYEFNNVELELGAMKSSIECLKTANLELEVGVGDLNISTLVVNNSTNIETSVGEVSITNGYINNLQLDTEISNFEYSGRILGESKIEVGIGNLELDLDEQDLYTVKVKVGTGKFMLNGEQCETDGTFMNGNNLIVIQGGIGDITINCEV